MLRTFASLLLAVLTLAACTSAPPEHADAPPPVWPPAPEAPRVIYQRSFSKPADLGIGRGVVERLRGYLFGDEEVQLVRPMAVTVAEQTIFVADPGVQGVHRFDARADRYTLIRGPDGAALPSPVGLAAGVAGAVYVTDSKLAQVFVIAAGASTAEPLPLGAALGQPTGVAFDGASQRLFVTDTAEHKVLVFGTDGRLLSTIGQRGAAAGEFNFPTLLWAAPQGRLYVTDSLNFRIQSFAADGRLIGAFGRMGDSVGDAARPKGIATDGFGHVYVVDSLLHNVQIFDSAGQFLLAVGEPGQGRGEFWLPVGIFVGADNLIYVADSYNRRVQVLRYIGGPT